MCVSDSSVAARSICSATGCSECSVTEDKFACVMRLACFVLIFSFFLSGCRNEIRISKSVTVEETVTESADAIAGEDPDLGRMVTRIYEGRCSDKHYSLTVESYEHSGDGTFRLEINKTESEDGPVVYVGKRYTLRGMEGDNDATVWQFVAEGGETFDFLYDGDADALALLGDKCEKSCVSCTLERSR